MLFAFSFTSAHVSSGFILERALVFAYLKIKSISDLDELACRLECIKKIELTSQQIHKVWTWKAKN